MEKIEMVNYRTGEIVEQQIPSVLELKNAIAAAFDKQAWDEAYNLIVDIAIYHSGNEQAQRDANQAMNILEVRKVNAEAQANRVVVQDDEPEFDPYDDTFDPFI